MLRLAAIFLVLAIIVAVLGFGGLAPASMGLFNAVFIVLLLLFLVSLMASSSLWKLRE